MIGPEAGAPQPIWDFRRLWSLWDMIRIYATAYMNLGINIGVSSTQYDVGYALRNAISVLGIAPPNDVSQLDTLQRQKALETLQGLRDLCLGLDLPVSSSLLKTIENNVPATNSEFTVYINAIYAELNSKLFLYVPSYRAHFFDKEDILSEPTRAAFPAAYSEVREAGNCFAAGRFTATVFHAMRAAEIGLRTLAATVNVILPFPVELADWQNLIEKVESEIKKLSQLPKSTTKDEEQQFYSEAATHFRYFKDAWRIRVSHVRETYDDAQALSILNHAREFFETLATRLSE